jgi:hypothetical protein
MLMDFSELYRNKEKYATWVKKIFEVKKQAESFLKNKIK